jgi:diadenosine tetraphosphatase ApaH/serine/threonine PP2A family protein phosphatase
LRSLVSVGAWILGNHDAFVLDTYYDTSYLTEAMRQAFTGDAQSSLMRLPGLCSADEQHGGDRLDLLLDTLARSALLATPQVVPADGCLLVHGSVRDPLIRYGTGMQGCNSFAASDELDFPATSGSRCLLMGHSHFPCLFFDDPAQQPRAQPQDLRPGRWTALPQDRRVVLNPGSVGQPRDANPQASYLLFDVERWRVKFLRVPYAVDETATLIIERGLPQTLAARLAHGE